MSGPREYSVTAASNLSVGGISIAEGWLPAAVNDAIRAQLADVSKLLLDFGGGIPTTGSGGAYSVSLSTAPSAYADNLLFVAKLNHAAPGAATMNVSGLGPKDFKQIAGGIASPMTPSDVPTGHRAICIYSTADNAVLMLNNASAGVLYEANGEDISTNIWDDQIDMVAPGGTYEWFNNANFAVLQGSFLVADEATGRAPPYKGDYNGWMPLLFARNYGTSNDPSPSTQQHPQDSEGTPKVYIRGGLVAREENDTLDLAFDRLNFDGSGLLTSPPNPTDATPVMRAYSRMASVDHFNVTAAAGTAKNISAINLATSTITTSTTHGLSIGNRVVFNGVGGTTQLNTSGEGYASKGYVVRTVPSSTTLTLETLGGVAINMAAWDAWTSGGTITLAVAHYGLKHPGANVDGRFALYQQRYVPALDYPTTGRFSGEHEFQASQPPTNDIPPSSLEVALRIKAPESVSGTTPLWLYVWDGTVSGFPFTNERQVKTKALGDLDPSDRVLYIDQSEPGIGRMAPYEQVMTDSAGSTLTTDDNGKTIYSATNNVTRAVFTGPATYPAGLRYTFMNGGTAGQRFVVGSGSIRNANVSGTKVENNPMRDGDTITVEAVSTAIFYIVAMVGAWTVS